MLQKLLCSLHEPEIPLTFGKDPNQFIESVLPIPDNAYEPQTSTHNWKIDRQNADLGDLSQRFNCLGMKQMESCGHHHTQIFSNLRVNIQQKGVEVVLIFLNKYRWFCADFLMAC